MSAPKKKNPGPPNSAQPNSKPADLNLKPKAKEAVLCDEEFVLRKRLPRSLPCERNDVYVSRKTPFKVQLDRCQSLLDSGEVVYVHGLGAAVSRAVNVALAVKTNNCGSVDLDVRTATVNLVDDIDYVDEDRIPSVQTRPNSVVHIKLFRPDVPVFVSN